MIYHSGGQIKKRSIKLPIIGLLEYVWAIAVILEGNSVYQHLTSIYLHLSLICMLISSLLFLVRGSVGIRKGAIETSFLLFIYSLLYFFAQSKMMSDEGFITSVLVGLPILVMLFELYVRRGEPFRLFYCLENVIFILTIFSLVLWLLGSVLNVIPHNSFLRINWGRDKIVNGYYSIQFEASMDTTYGIEDIYRNQSIFTEAPMYNLWLCIALSTEMFLQKSVSKTKCVVLILGILSTISTTGALFCFLIFGLRYFEKITKGKPIPKVLFSLFLVSIVPAALYLMQLIYSYKSTTISYAIRSRDYIVGWKAFRENPLFGTGFGSLANLKSSLGTEIGFSNSIMVVLSTGGLWLTALFFISLAGYFVRRDQMSGSTVKFAICYIFLYVFVSFSARYIAITYWALGIALLLNQKRGIQAGGRNTVSRKRRLKNEEGIRT